MPGTTTAFGFRYQLPAEPPDGAALGKNLAEDVEARILTERSIPVGRILQTVAQTSLASTAVTAITFSGTDEVDTHNFHNPASNNTRVTPNVAGHYRVHGAVACSGATDYTGVQAYIGKNGTAVAPANRIVPGNTSNTLVLPTSALVACNGSSDYFELYFVHSRNAAGTAATVASVQFTSTLEWEYLRPL